MSYYLIFFIGFMVGGAAGLLIAAVMGAAAHGDYYADLHDAYQAGVDAGKVKPDCVLAKNVAALDRGIED